MSMRRVEVTEERINDGVNTYYQGDAVTLPKEKADAWIAAGWAKCSTTGEQGERKPGPVTLDVKSVQQNTANKVT